MLHHLLIVTQEESFGLDGVGGGPFSPGKACAENILILFKKVLQSLSLSAGRHLLGVKYITSLGSIVGTVIERQNPPGSSFSSYGVDLHSQGTVALQSSVFIT